MSSIYVQEPPTEGKVLLETTVGDIDIELWSRECPKACRNFIQLCMEGYYDRTIFHRLVKGFIVQGGDPTGTGTGGNSIWDKPFKDEVHSRLRFMRRGLVAMANSGKDDNGSQFFFTLGATPELQNKHTVFGKVGGNTVFNMIKLEEGGVDDNERPLYPHKILKAKILNNPFEDIVPREPVKSSKGKKEKKKSTAAATKNFSLLSFGEEAEEEEEQVVQLNRKYSGKGKSSHELTQDKKLSNIPAVDISTLSKEDDKEKDEKKVEPIKEEIDSHSSSEASDEEEEDKPKLDIGQISAVKEKLKGKHNKKPETKREKEEKEDHNVDLDVEEYYLGKADKLEERKRIEEIKKEYKLLKRSMKEEKETVDDEKARAKEAAEERDAELAKSNSVVKEFFEEQKIYKEKKSVAKKGVDREAQTLALLEKFKNKISSAKESFPEGEEPATKVDPTPKPKGVLYESVQDDDPSDTSWLAKSLHNEVEEDVLAKDANKKSDDWYEIYDPKNPLNRRRRGETKRAEEEKWKKFKPTD